MDQGIVVQIFLMVKKIQALRFRLLVQRLVISQFLQRRFKVQYHHLMVGLEIIIQNRYHLTVQDDNHCLLLHWLQIPTLLRLLLSEVQSHLQTPLELHQISELKRPPALLKLSQFRVQIPITCLVVPIPQKKLSIIL